MKRKKAETRLAHNQLVSGSPKCDRERQRSTWQSAARPVLPGARMPKKQVARHQQSPTSHRKKRSATRWLLELLTRNPKDIPDLPVVSSLFLLDSFPLTTTEVGKPLEGNLPRGLANHNTTHGKTVLLMEIHGVWCFCSGKTTGVSTMSCFNLFPFWGDLPHPPLKTWLSLRIVGVPAKQVPFMLPHGIRDGFRRQAYLALRGMKTLAVRMERQMSGFVPRTAWGLR